MPLLIASLSQIVYWEWPGTEHEAGVESVQFYVEGDGEEHREGSGEGRAENSFPPLLLLIFGAFGVIIIVRFIWMLVLALRALGLTIRTAGSLREVASPRADGTLVVPSKKPEAFVVGVAPPMLFVSEGLLEMPKSVIQAVLEHEQAHIRRWDGLRYYLILLGCAFHLPGIAGRLKQRAHQVQELAADAEAATAVGDTSVVADALVQCAQFHKSQPAPHLAFGGGDLRERVQTLLGEHRTVDQPRPWFIALIAAAVVYLSALYAEPVHHLIESLFSYSP